MRRNADLDYVVRNPIIQAINVVLTTKKSSKFGIISCAAGLLLSFCCYLKFKRKQKKITTLQDKIKLQSPLNKNLLILLDESWRDGKYDEFTYLLPQYKQYGKMTVFKNIFLYVQMDSNMQLGNLNFSVNSNNLDQIIRKKVQRTDLSQALTPKLTQFVSENIHIDFIRKSNMISSAFLKDFDENQIYSGLISELRKYPKQKLLIFEYLSQKIIGTNTLFDGNQISWEYPTPFSVSKGNQLCMKCTAIMLDDEVRVTNVKAIASDFVRLKYFLEANIMAKLRILKTKINLTKVSMAIFGLLTIYQVGKYILNQLEPYMLKKEYPGLDQIKSKFNFAYCDQGTRCIHCKSRPASFIFIPCYHLQCCKQCFDECNQIECKTCKITIYCGISVFVCK
ncbi:unnamed protein product [Paramecium octaurelia]|uniref:RING-type domain-containing protein n=1 Tax=Paramecium octaurelia TaxID=43137 RepID=A0A8S1US27_PAROT|nr:unnamed protein product [Paramecium octaurelia]